MPNIFQNDELLRVQDENCDIVFNYDKHENGGVAVHAEKDGQNQKVSSEYARAALVKKIGSGGGGADPVLDNAKTTGGIGWTEQGEQTTITWDGNTDGRDSINDYYFKVADVMPSEDDFRNARILLIGIEEWVDIGEGTQFADILTRYANGLVVVADAAGTIETEGVSLIVPSAGIYFMKESNDATYVTSLTYGTPDIIHKIDSKYIDAISDLDTIRNNASAGASKISCTDAQVGSYGYIKLSDLPTYDGSVI